MTDLEGRESREDKQAAKCPGMSQHSDGDGVGRVGCGGDVISGVDVDMTGERRWTSGRGVPPEALGPDTIIL